MKRNIKLFCLKLKSKLYEFLYIRKNNKNVAILTSSKWKNRVSDDLLIKNELLKNKVNASIVAWDEKNDFTKYDLILIRTIWGYEKNINEFEEFLKNIEKNKIKIINNISILKNNYDKEKQINLLDKYKVKHIDTKFIDVDTKDIFKEIKDMGNDLVIKPIISASGNDTYLVSDNSDRKNVIKFNEINDKLKNVNKGKKLMVQPFIKEIDEGEISLIYINGLFTHAVRRFPSVFNNKSSIKVIDPNILDKNMFEVVENVLNIKEYKNSFYERIDLVKINDEYYVMEIELVEPDLFIRNITDKELKKFVVKRIALNIKKQL